MARKKKSDDLQEELREEISDELREMGILAEGGEAPTESDAPVAIAPHEHEHYLQIREMNRDVLDVYWKWDAAKENAGALKKDLDRLRSELSQLISRGPDPQLPLFKGDDGDESWKSRSVDVLAISESVAQKLTDGGLSTLGELKVFWDGGGELTEKDGIGPETAAKVSDAFAEYALAHPEVYGEQPAEEAAV